MPTSDRLKRRGDRTAEAKLRFRIGAARGGFIAGRASRSAAPAGG